MSNAWNRTANMQWYKKRTLLSHSGELVEPDEPFELFTVFMAEYMFNQSMCSVFQMLSHLFRGRSGFLMLYDDYRNNKTFSEWPGSLRRIWAILSYFLWHILAVVLAPINKVLLDQSKTDSEVQHLFPQTGSHLTDGTKFEFLFSSKPLFPYCDSCHWKI